jgi:hypothetical protein
MPRSDQHTIDARDVRFAKYLRRVLQALRDDFDISDYAER